MSDITEDEVKYLMCTALQLNFCLVNAMYSFVALAIPRHILEA